MELGIRTRTWMSSAVILAAFSAFVICGTAVNADTPPSSAGSADAANASAADNSSQGASSSSSGSNAAAGGQPLQAGVQIIELDMKVLRDLGLDIKNILKAASSLYDEVTIQPVTLMTEPEVVGMGTIINIPVGFTPTGAGPQPTKKRVDMAMNQMRPVIQLMKQDVDEFEAGKVRLDLSDDERAELRPLFQEWVELVKKVNEELGSLEGLTKSPPYDNGAIAKAAGSIHKDAKSMDEVRRKLYKFLQKEGKKKKSEKKSKSAS